MAKDKLMDFEQALELFEPVLGFEVHVELNTKTKMFSGAREPGAPRQPRVRAEHAGRAGRHGSARLAADRERRGGEVLDQPRARPRLLDRAVEPVRAQELLLPRPRQELPDLAVRRADRVRGLGRRGPLRRHHGHRADRARPHGRGCRQADARRRLDRSHPGRRVLAGRLQPRRRAARRDRHEADLRRRAPCPRDREGVRPDDPRHRALAGDLGSPHGARQPPLRRERVDPAAGPGEARNAHRDQERQLHALGRARRAVRDPAPGRDPRRRWHDHAGDPALARGHRHDLARSPQVRRRRLPLLPRARPAARSRPRWS